jgi:hypothetical protein
VHCALSCGILCYPVLPCGPLFYPVLFSMSLLHLLAWIVNCNYCGCTFWSTIIKIPANPQEVWHWTSASSFSSSTLFFSVPPAHKILQNKTLPKFWYYWKWCIIKSIKCKAHIPTSVSNSVLNFQYRGRYNTGISKIPANTGIEFFSRNIPLPLKKVGNLMSKQQ